MADKAASTAGVNTADKKPRTHKTGLELISLENMHHARWIQQERMIKGAAGTSSIREFGGLWGVDGMFLLNGAVAHGAKLASMIDITPTPGFKKKIAEARETNPDMEIEFVNTDFRWGELYRTILPVDTSLLLNVLLHQDNYVSVIGGVCGLSRKYVCVTQPCLKESFFSVPSSATLLQFWPDEVRKKYQKDALWPADEGRPAAFSTASWMWGHSTSHLIDVFKGYGWKLEDGIVLDGFLGEHWECPVLRFVPTEHARQFKHAYRF